MKEVIRIRELIFLFGCLALGVLGELSFFHGQIGISFLVFITGFYAVLFSRIRLEFANRRIGILLMAVIWILAGTYTYYDNQLFYGLNILLIPVLTFFHIVLITQANHAKWSKPMFITLLAGKFKSGIEYVVSFINIIFSRLFKDLNPGTVKSIKQIVIGLVIGLPLLFVMTLLLMSADREFADMILQLPTNIINMSVLEGVIRSVMAVVMGLLFFGVFQVLKQSGKNKTADNNTDIEGMRWNSITPLTILFLLNFIYVVFSMIQFKYFFGQGLHEGYTYAEYARRGFFELLCVTLINWTLLITCLKTVRTEHRGMKQTLKAMYTLLVGVSAIMLISSYQRLGMYEVAYGYTLDRLLAHAFMIFLMVIYAYTFIRIWIERLALLHFYLIVGLVFYTGLNAVGLEKIVVNNNLERYKVTEKIDMEYMTGLSWTGIDGLMDLYELEPEYPGLERYLHKQKQRVEEMENESWQSYNLTRDRVKNRLAGLEL